MMSTHDFTGSRVATDGPPSRKQHEIAGGGDRYEALLEVLQQQKEQAEEDREREAADRHRRSERGTRGYLRVIVLVVVAAWLWIFPPPILRIEPPAPPPRAEEEASLRFAMYVQAQRIEAFRREEGHLPDHLDAAGPPLPNMRYVRLGEEIYQLNGSTERVTLTYRSDLPLRDFVGAGADVLDESRIP
jgi:hypothetical protein